MNHFKYISPRVSWCQVKRLQSSSANSTIEIPARIERSPTDILSVLESTIPKSSIRSNLVYHDDPLLLPYKKQHYRIYALSYESGKKTAMWVHKQHGNMFPSKLSDPPVKAFKPPLKIKPAFHKDKVTEQMLLDAISEYRASDAIDIHDLLEPNVSATAKQALLELLCFYNSETIPHKELHYEQWYSKPTNLVWKHNAHTSELYEFLIKQDPKTAALAHNAMLCGLLKYLRGGEGWRLYEKCEKENIPLNVTTFNYVIMIIAEVFSNRNVDEKVKCLYNILKSMNDRGVKPNVRTLNAILKVTIKLPKNVAERVMRRVCKEFKQLNIKFSLATYYYIINILARKGAHSYNDFMNILHEISGQSFTIQDPVDVKFFVNAMFINLQLYHERKFADTIHSILLTGDNYKFISDNIAENGYYNSYLSVVLKTSTIDEFFELYDKFVPCIFIPTTQLLSKITNELKYQKPTAVAKYVAQLWSNVIEFGYADLSLKLDVISLMNIDAVPVDSPLRTVFINAAWNCWTDIKTEIQNKPESYAPVETALMGSIALMLLSDNRINESMEVLKYIVEQLHLFIPTMTEDQLNKLFENCISKDCIEGAFLLLEYTTNFGFPHTEMAKKLYKHPKLEDTDRNKLINLVGEQALDTSDTLKS